MNNEDKVIKLELNLAEAQMIAEDSDKKYDEVRKPNQRRILRCL